MAVGVILAFGVSADGVGDGAVVSVSTLVRTKALAVFMRPVTFQTNLLLLKI